MRKKLDTRFPAARIKKIMQADEDVGKIALAVPVLVSKALELFLQDLCDRTYDITLQRGAKTMNSLHLKHCVHSYSVFDFLKEIVSKVPDYGHSHSDVSGEDRHVSRRRKAPSEDYNDSDEESKRSRMHEGGHASSNGRGRGRGRGRGKGRGRGAHSVEKETPQHEIELPDSSAVTDQSVKQNPSPRSVVDNGTEPKEPENKMTSNNDANPPVRNFDLNAGVDENDSTTKATVTEASASKQTQTEAEHEEYPGWSLSEMDRMAIDPLQLARMSSTVEEDEDYDEEG